ncbi:MAG: mechanosensitive ion channel domain-containing protein [Stellaceae bacterium]
MKAILSLIPPWVLGAIVMVVPAMVALAIYRWLTRWLIRLAGRHSPFLQRLLQRGQGPASVFVVIFALGAALPAARFSYPLTIALGRALLVAFILNVGWAAAITIDISITIYLRRFRTDVEDNLLARKHVTQMRILQRVATTLLAVVTVASALMTFESVRQYGISLFASAGAAGIILGLAARPVLGNLLAGIQIAMTQPIRVEDQVVVEGESGWIETITSTYVVIRIWDLRRMIVPLTYFIEKPFQNWTYENTAQIGSVLLHVDYTVPVEPLRRKLDEVLRQSKLWDGKVANLQVTDTPQGMVELRALVSARSPGQTWDLRCEVREKLIAFLQAEYPQALPRQRMDLGGYLGERLATGDPEPDGVAKLASRGEPAPQH